MTPARTYRRINKALRLAQSEAAENVLAAALEILATRIKHGDAMNSPSAVRDYLRLLLHDRDHEVFVVVLLDAQHRVIATEELFRGTLTQTSVYPREVVKLALKHNSASVIFAHNHPSGIAEPSRADELLTTSLKQALALVDIKVLDHIIVAGATGLSFAERGLLLNPLWKGNKNALVHLAWRSNSPGSHQIRSHGSLDIRPIRGPAGSPVRGRRGCHMRRPMVPAAKVPETLTVPRQ